MGAFSPFEAAKLNKKRLSPNSWFKKNQISR
jgi:hypothetical protein